MNEFLSPYEVLFDKRLGKRFRDTIQGIIGAESLRVMKIATFSPNRQENASSTAKAIYRFLWNDDFSAQELLKPLYKKTKEDFRNEKKVIGVIDLSPWEKPYARKMEGLSKVKKKDKSGTVNGYMAVSVLFISKNKKGLGYFHLFSYEKFSYEESMSQNKQIERAIEEARKLLPAEAKITWVWDRGFDDGKNYKDVLGNGEDFIGRVYQNRNVEVKGKPRKLLDWGEGLPVKTRFKTKMFFKGKVREVEIELAWGKCVWKGEVLYLLRSQIVWVEGIDIRSWKEEDRTWWLLTNIPIRSRERALKVWEIYRKRWAIEDFFKFVKDGLGGEEFQVLGLARIRKLVSMVVIAGAFIYDLGPTTETPLVQVLLMLGGWSGSKHDKPGKEVLKRGLSMLFTYIVVGEFMKGYKGSS